MCPSKLWLRLSPSTKTFSGGTTTGPNSYCASSAVKGSSCSSPFTYSFPLLTSTSSPYYNNTPKNHLVPLETISQRYSNEIGASLNPSTYLNSHDPLNECLSGTSTTLSILTNHKFSKGLRRIEDNYLLSVKRLDSFRYLFHS